ncbi:MAG: calcium-binding protein [Alphaproteobacteria bacterium]|nr:calcium-binding protein [Alphaproteobacteria bacterium]
MPFDVNIKHNFFDLSNLIDFTALTGFSLDYEATLTTFGGSAALWTPVSLSASQFVFTSGTGYTMTISGSGISPISSLADLETAMANGIATGTLNSVVFSNGVTDFLSVAFTATGYTVSSGNQSLVITGATPTGLDQFYDVGQMFGSLANIGTLTQPQIDQLVTDLSAYGISGITIKDGSTDLVSLQFGTSSLSLTVDGYEFAINGLFPGDFGQALSLAQEISTLASAGTPFNLASITGLGFDSFTVTAPDATVLLAMVGPFLGDGSDVLNQITIDGVVYSNGIFGDDFLDDNLTGTNSGDHMFGMDGNDRLYGNNGNDYLYGGFGMDYLDGGAGNDTLNPGDNIGGLYGWDSIGGSVGNDQIIYSDNVTGWQSLWYGSLTAGISVAINGAGNSATVDKGINGFDTITDIVNPMRAAGFGLYGTQYSDVFNINAGANSWINVRGWQGADTYNITLSGTVRLDFRSGTNAANVNLGTRTISDDGFGNAETLNVTGNSGQLGIRGTNYNDILIGDAGNNTIDGRGGIDALAGGAGNDSYRVDDSADTVTELAGEGKDTVRSSAASYALSANVENLFYWGSGDFSGTGNALNNRITGGVGNDTLVGGLGRDVLIGGDGTDTVSYAGAAGAQQVYLTWGKAKGADGTDKLTSIENLTGSDFADRLIGNSGANTIYGGAGNDLIVSKGGTDQMFGEAGDDRIAGGAQADYAEGGAGADRITGSGGDDVLHGNAGDDFLYGNGGNDRLFGAADSDKLYGGKGNDTLDGGAGSDRLFGGRGNDSVLGGDGVDYLYGDKGTDTLNGGLGNDSLTGGLNNDTFVFAAGQGYDKIKDWEDGIDQIDLTNFALGSIANVLALAFDYSAGVRLEFADGSMLLIENTTKAQLDAGDFVL